MKVANLLTFIKLENTENHRYLRVVSTKTGIPLNMPFLEANTNAVSKPTEISMP